MSALFVSATGTDMGKTHVTAGLARTLRGLGIDTLALKPVASGYDPAQAETSDPGLLLAATGQARDAAAIAAISPWRFAAPLSPDMAARLEGERLQLTDIAAFCADRIARHRGATLIEGAGGLMTPVAEDGTCLDLIQALGCPALLVAGSYLGAISHALTAIEACAARGAALAAVVVNETPGATVALDATLESLRCFAPATRFIAMPRGQNDAEAFQAIARACGFGG